MNNLLLDENRTKRASNVIYFAKVIRFYPSSNTVDVVTIDNNISLLNCNVLCSIPSGFIHGSRYFPTYDDQNSEIEYVNSSGDIYCAAAFLDGDFNNAVILGFLFPLQTTLSIAEHGLYIFRHESDVMWMVRGDGTVQIYHPSGSFIKIGDTDENEMTDNIDSAGLYPAKTDGMYVVPADQYNEIKDTNFYIQWHQGQKITLDNDGNLIVKTKDDKAALTMTADGNVTITANNPITFEASSSFNINAPGQTVNVTANQINLIKG